ncbi:hypothetical protein DL98DRAFT_537358 [Cadophora sp. DSE1049]|nr:hypothetical protein DL98DRAFT_537358 [Cadophora sp. DSE1049]
MASQPPPSDMENEITDTTLTGPNLTFRRTTFLNTTLHKLSITASTFTCCNLVKTNITGSTIKNCTLSNCNISNSTLVDCKLTNSTLHESPFVKSKLSGCHVTTSIVSGKSPALLVALRGDKELYEQALAVYYQVNYLELESWQSYDIHANIVKSLSAKARFNVRMLRIKHRAGRYPPKETVTLLQHYTNIETILMEKTSLMTGKSMVCSLVIGLKTVRKVYAELGPPRFKEYSMTRFKAAFRNDGYAVGA